MGPPHRRDREAARDPWRGGAGPDRGRDPTSAHSACARRQEGRRQEPSRGRRSYRGTSSRGSAGSSIARTENSFEPSGAAIEETGLREVYEYHSAMEGDPESTLHVFEQSGGVVIAIRCLDEGVDIPAATHALILASSRNPREFIQRRGPRSADRTREVDCAHPRRHRPPFRPWSRGANRFDGEG